MEKYYQNYILCGEIDFHCLICRLTMHREDLDKHIEDSYHEVSKFRAELLEEYKVDGIYQIRIFYYCMFCNRIEKRSKIRRHISQDRHISFRNLTNIPTRELNGKYMDGNIVFKTDNNTTKILRKWQWHGIIDRKCLLCNVTVDCIDEHISNRDHIIRLIKTYVKDQNCFYRHINEKLFQCFSCMKLLSNDNLQNHISTKEHKNNKQKFIIEDDKIRSKLEGYTSNYDQIIDYGKIRAELSQYGKKHHIKLNEGGTKGFCTLCTKLLSGEMSVFKCHVKGSVHRSHLKLRATKMPPIKPDLDCDYERKPFMEILTKVIYLTDIGAFFINKVYLISQSKFFMWKIVEMDKNNKKCICLGCNVEFPYGEEFKHCTTLKHRKSFFSNVVRLAYEPDDHVLREIKPNLAHCCICNNLFPFWKTLTGSAQKCNNKREELNTPFPHSKGNIVEIKLSRNHDLFYFNLLRAVFDENI